MTPREGTEPELEEAIRLVLAFTSTMNDWETRRYYRSRADAGYFTAASDAMRAGGATAEELDREYEVILERHCTSRPRTHGGFPSSWSKGGQYVGVDEGSVLEARRPHRNRIEIICKGGMFPEQQYKFVVFRKKQRWLIDNVLARSGDEAWRRSYL
jgi:hypothetical protein